MLSFGKLRFLVIAECLGGPEAIRLAGIRTESSCRRMSREHAGNGYTISHPAACVQRHDFFRGEVFDGGIPDWPLAEAVPIIPAMDFPS
jgi:hypothetical protein